MELIEAAKNGDIPTVKRLLEEGADIEFKDPLYESTALMYASQESNRKGSLDMVKFLLDAGADVNASNKSQLTSLMFAAKDSNNSSSLDTVKLLLDYGANVNAASKQGLTSLMKASEYSNTTSSLDTVKLLLDYGADIDADIDGLTSLYFATKASNTTSSPETVKLLLDRGANVDGGLASSGNTILLSLVLLLSPSFGQSVSPEAVKLLLEYGANVNAVGRNQSTSLISLSSNNRPYAVDLAKLMLDRGADVNAADNQGNTSLHYATEYSSEEMVKLLLEYGANVNAINNHGDTSLYRASNGGQENMIELLLRYGANPFIKNDRGRYPLNDCRSFTCMEIISQAMWDRLYASDKRLAAQFSKSGDIRLPREIWELILLRKRQKALCRDLSSNRNRYVLMAFANMLEIPVSLNMTKSHLCTLISEQLTWGGKYSEESQQYSTSRLINAKRSLLEVAYKLGVDIDRPMNEILDDVSKMLDVLNI